MPDNKEADECISFDVVDAARWLLGFDHDPEAQADRDRVNTIIRDLCADINAGTLQLASNSPKVEAWHRRSYKARISEGALRTWGKPRGLPRAEQPTAPAAPEQVRNVGGRKPTARDFVANNREIILQTARKIYDAEVAQDTPIPAPCKVVRASAFTRKLFEDKSFAGLDIDDHQYTENYGISPVRLIKVVAIAWRDAKAKRAARK